MSGNRCIFDATAHSLAVFSGTCATQNFFTCDLTQRSGLFYLSAPATPKTMDQDIDDLDFCLNRIPQITRNLRLTSIFCGQQIGQSSLGAGDIVNAFRPLSMKGPIGKKNQEMKKKSRISAGRMNAVKRRIKIRSTTREGGSVSNVLAYHHRHHHLEFKP